MGSLKFELIDYSPRLSPGSQFQVKLDGWRCTVLINGDISGLLINGMDMKKMLFSNSTAGAGRIYNPVQWRLGGLVVKGMPVLLDDYFTIKVSDAFVNLVTSVVVLKELYVADRVGPDVETNQALERKPNADPTTTKGPQRGAGPVRTHQGQRTRLGDRRRGG